MTQAHDLIKSDNNANTIQQEKQVVQKTRRSQSESETEHINCDKIIQIPKKEPINMKMEDFNSKIDVEAHDKEIWDKKREENVEKVRQVWIPKSKQTSDNKEKANDVDGVYTEGECESNEDYGYSMDINDMYNKERNGNSRDYQQRDHKNDRYNGDNQNQRLKEGENCEKRNWRYDRQRNTNHGRDKKHWDEQTRQKSSFFGRTPHEYRYRDDALQRSVNSQNVEGRWDIFKRHRRQEIQRDYTNGNERRGYHQSRNRGRGRGYGRRRGSNRGRRVPLGMNRQFKRSYEFNDHIREGEEDMNANTNKRYNYRF